MTRYCAMGLLLSLFCSQLSATCTQYLHYRGQGVELAIMENFDSDRPLAELIAEAQIALPMLSGWEAELTDEDPRHGFHFACGQYNQASYWVNAEKISEHPCEAQGTAATLQAMLEGQGWSGRKETTFSGYAIQLAYLPQGYGKNAEWLRWEHHLFERQDLESPEALFIVGDCEQQSLWLHHYPSGDTGLRFGLFHHYRDALKAIELFQLPPNHAQIVRHAFQFDALQEYIQH